MPDYGPGAPALIEAGSHLIKEFPISTHEVGGRHLVYSGGGYFRLFPYPLIRRWMRQSPEYVMSYIHPRDLDAGQPMIKELPLHRKFKSYVNLAGAEAKLRRMLTDFKFTDLATASASIDWDKAMMNRADL